MGPNLGCVYLKSFFLCRFCHETGGKNYKAFYILHFRHQTKELNYVVAEMLWIYQLPSDLTVDPPKLVRHRPKQ